MRDLRDQVNIVKGGTRGIVAVVAFIVLGASEPSERTDDPVSLLLQMPARYAAVSDYTAVLVLQERTSLGLGPRESIEFKFARPFKVFMRWLDGPGSGRQVLYVESENHNKLLARETGLFGLLTFRLDPQGALAMRGHRHPITEAGIGVMIAHINRRLKPGSGSRGPRVIDLGEAWVARRRTRKIVLELPPDRDPTKIARIVVWVDSELGLPIQTESFDRDERMVGFASYTQLRVNAGLGRRNFDPDNPAYRFSRGRLW